MIHFIVKAFQIVAVLGCVSSSIYYLLCLWSAASFLRGQRAGGGDRSTLALPPVSILKPLKGTDPDIYESFRSHCLQDYPRYEIIFGVSDPDDPAVASVRQLQREFPSHAIQLIVSPNKLGANVKVSNLEQMLPAGALSAPHRQRQRYSRRVRLSSPRDRTARGRACGHGHVSLPGHRCRNARIAAGSRWASVQIFAPACSWLGNWKAGCASAWDRR